MTDAGGLPEGSRGTLREFFRERITPAGVAVGSRFAAWAAERGLTWVEDASNRDPAFARNFSILETVVSIGTQLV